MHKNNSPVYLSDLSHSETQSVTAALSACCLCGLWVSVRDCLYSLSVRFSCRKAKPRYSSWGFYEVGLGWMICSLHILKCVPLQVLKLLTYSESSPLTVQNMDRAFLVSKVKPLPKCLKPVFCLIIRLHC